METGIELHEQFMQAFAQMEDTGEHLFITGRAGTGKSTLLKYFRQNTKKKVVVLAPTGVAALNVLGQTIHSFFGIPPAITPQQAEHERLSKRFKEVAKSIQAIIVDEVSMVRAELLDCIDILLRRARGVEEPFGGLQMIFIGDLFQLSPVITRHENPSSFLMAYQSPYFFDSYVLARCTLRTIQLEKIYRQRDQAFIELLNRVRENQVTADDLAQLNCRVDAALENEDRSPTIVLTATNAVADAINERRLAQLSVGAFTYEGRLQGSVEERSLPTPSTLTLKHGAQVMLLVNDSAGGYVNGTIGTVVSIEAGSVQTPDKVIVEIGYGEEVEVTPHTWEFHRYTFNPETRSLEAEVLGTYVQYPLRLAWAVTIHKSQGKTFDRVCIDLGSGAFAHGQVYVALSRCRTLEGISLVRPLQRRDIRMDERVRTFFGK